MANETIYETCNVWVIARKDGKIISAQEGHNVWTNTGREYSCLVKSMNYLGQRFRNDSIQYIGLGNGTQIESASVSRLVNPIAYDGNVWLKKIENTLTTFPDNGSRLSIRYSAIFGPNTFNSDGGVAYISECGLFTNGDPIDFSTEPGRDRSLSNAYLQSPVAYHTFEPIPKTSNIEIEIMWELRH